MLSISEAETLLGFVAERRTETGREGVLKDLGFRPCGQGSFKHVFVSKEYGVVVKLCTGEGNDEPRNYMTAPAHIRPFLLPLLAWNDTIQVQEYVPNGECDPKTCPVDGWEMNDIWSGQGSGRNHTHRDGTVVIYDYGQTDQWKLCKEEAA